ncbi:MAG: VWA domain-containing protein [Cytophagales bacterium]|nr:MAG: VWA domain-containing protein [Cytophagales bacterium]
MNLVPVTPSPSASLALQQALKQPMKATPYTASIMRQNPTAFVFLIDQSGSMSEPTHYRGLACSKAEAVAQIVNQTLLELLLRSQKGDEIRHYYDVSLIGYGGAEHANLLWTGAWANQPFLSPAELLRATVREEESVVERRIRDRVIRTTEKRPIWLEPVARYKTPMKSALLLAESLLQTWVATQAGKDVYPPTVINITDGVATDATADELLDCADRIRQLHTLDGPILLMNIHLSDETGKSVQFPGHVRDLADDPQARLLYDLSSEMPASYHADIAGLFGLDQRARYVGMCSNTDMDALVKFMNIGTPTQQNGAFAVNFRADR